MNAVGTRVVALAAVLSACASFTGNEAPSHPAPRDADDGWTDVRPAATALAEVAPCEGFTNISENCALARVEVSATKSSPATAPEEPAIDFADEVRLLYRVAACGGEGPLPEGLDAEVVAAHCREILPKFAAYRARYLSVAVPFLRKLRPTDVPEDVVYPFGGGDLVTALSAYPSAHVITTISLELAGDPRRITGMGPTSLKRSLKRMRGELSELLFVDDYSRSETLKGTQRGDIPGELGLFLAGLVVQGFEPVHLRYFRIDSEGTLHYLTKRELDETDQTLASKRKATWIAPDFSEAFANSEISFRRKGAGPNEPEVVHRHISENLSDSELIRRPALLRHLERKGPVAAMTKAASYLLWNDGFSAIRSYLLDHAVFMFSDSTGIPPEFTERAGLVQETYGTFRGSLLRANARYNAEFVALWQSQPKRKLPFRFGYLSAKQAHLLVTKQR